jgi:hypothetical protein
MKNHAIILFYILFSVQVWDKFMKNIKMKMDSYILLTVEKIHLDVECNQLLKPQMKVIYFRVEC